MPVGTMISARPARPTTALSFVAVATRSRAIVRQRITCSGTEPAIIAATLESIRVSASVTTPTPQREERHPEADGGASLAPRDTQRCPSRARGSPRAGGRRAVNRSPAERSGGSVRTETLIAKYVEPQTR